MSTHRLFATCILLVLASTASATDQATEPASATLIDRQGQSVGTATFIDPASPGSPIAASSAFAETQAGKGTVVSSHPLNVGGVGETGCLAANLLAKEADLVIGAVLVPGAAAPKLVTRAQLSLLSRGMITPICRVRRVRSIWACILGR